MSETRMGPDYNTVTTCDDETADLGMWIALLFRRWRLVTGIPLLVSILAVILSFLLTPRYTSFSKIMLPYGNNENNLIGMLGQFGSMAGISTAGDYGTDSADFYKEIMTSSSMAEHLIEKFRLHDLYNIEKSPEGHESLIATIKQCIRVDSIKGGFIELSAETLTPNLAQNIAYEVVLSTNETINHLNIAKAKEKREFLEKRVDEVYGDIQSLTVDIQNFYDKNHIIELNEQSRQSVDTVSQLLTQIESLRVKLDVQAASIGRDHPDYTSTKLEMDEISKRFRQLMTGRTDEISDSHGYYAINIAPLLTIDNIPSLNLKNLELTREMTIQSNLLALLRQQFEMAKLEEKKEDLYLRVLDSPTLPTKKSWPKKFNILVIVYSVMLFIVVVLIVIKNTSEKCGFQHV